MRKKTFILIVVICMIVPIMSCGVSSQKRIDRTTETEAALQESGDGSESAEETLSERSEDSLHPEYLSDQKSSVFSGYDGSEICIERKKYDETNLIMFPDMNDVYYWKSDNEAVTVEEAAEKLISIMLDSINEIPEEYRLFTLTDYNIYPTTYYSSWTVGEVMQGMKLPENTWIFSPEYTFDYVGKTFFSEREDCEQKGYIAEDGLVVNLRQGMPEDMYYVIMEQDHVWRLEKLSAMLLNYETVTE